MVGPVETAAASIAAQANGHGPIQKHPRFWFDDGSLLVVVGSTAWRLHESFLALHSCKARQWTLDADDPWVRAVAKQTGAPASVPVLTPPKDAGVAASDFEVFVQHMYHDAAVGPTTPYPALASLLRIASPKQLDWSPIAMRARERLAQLFPGGSKPFTHLHDRAHLEEALEFALHYPVNPETKKALIYSVATSTNFDPQNAHNPEPAESTPETGDARPHPALSVRSLRVCHRVLGALCAAFTPLLFTVGGAQHMACTDALADRWMADVIAPALADGGAARPLETLASVAAWDWAGAGVCAECVEGKRAEWAEEARRMWESLDAWVEEAEEAEGNV